MKNTKQREEERKEKEFNSREEKIKMFEWFELIDLIKLSDEEQQHKYMRYLFDRIKKPSTELKTKIIPKILSSPTTAAICVHWKSLLSQLRELIGIEKFATLYYICVNYSVDKDIYFFRKNVEIIKGLLLEIENKTINLMLIGRVGSVESILEINRTMAVIKIVKSLYLINKKEYVPSNESEENYYSKRIISKSPSPSIQLHSPSIHSPNNSINVVENYNSNDETNETNSIQLNKSKDDIIADLENIEIIDYATISPNPSIEEQSKNTQTQIEKKQIKEIILKPIPLDQFQEVVETVSFSLLEILNGCEYSLYISDERQYTVSIPAGIVENSKIRINHNTSLIVKYKEDDKYKRIGNDLHAYYQYPKSKENEDIPIQYIDGTELDKTITLTDNNIVEILNLGFINERSKRRGKFIIHISLFN